MNLKFIQNQQAATYSILCFGFLGLVVGLGALPQTGMQISPTPLPISQIQPTSSAPLSYDDVYSTDFSPDGHWIATGGIEGIARIWDAQTAKLLYSFIDRPRYTLTVKFSNDGNYLFTSSEDDVITNNNAWVQMWDIQKGVVIKRFEGSMIGIIASNHLLLRATKHSPSRLVDILTGDTIKTFRNNFLGVSLSSDGKWFSIANFSLTGVQLWDLNTETLLYTFVPPGPPIGDFSATMVFSPNSKEILVQPRDHNVFLLDLTTFSIIHTFPSTDGGAVFSATGHEITQLGLDGSIQWLSIDTGKMIRKLPANFVRKHITQLVFLPDGTQFLTARYDESAHLWDSLTGDELKIYDSHAR